MFSLLLKLIAIYPITVFFVYFPKFIELRIVACLNNTTLFYTYRRIIIDALLDDFYYIVELCHLFYFVL